MNECVYCEGVADFQWLDGGWYVCTGCIKEGQTDTEAEEGEGETLQQRADRTNPYLLTTKREGK
jgi:hypothetical protein